MTVERESWDGIASIVLAVRPEYADAILLGKKTLDLRRGDLSHLGGRRIYLYACSPVKKVVGAFTAGVVEVREVRDAFDVRALFRIWGERAAVSEPFMQEYYQDYKGFASAIPVERPCRIDFGGVALLGHPPQSWRYATPDERALVEENLIPQDRLNERIAAARRRLESERGNV